MRFILLTHFEAVLVVRTDTEKPERVTPRSKYAGRVFSKGKEQNGVCAGHHKHHGRHHHHHRHHHLHCYHSQHTGCLPCYSQRCRPQSHANNSPYTGCVRWCLLRRRPNSNVDNWPHNVVRRCVSSPLAHSWSWPIANLIIGWPMSNVILGAAEKHVTSVTWRRVEGGAQRLVSLAAPRF